MTGIQEKMMQNEDAIFLTLPSPTLEENLMHEKKQVLLSKRSLPVTFSLKRDEELLDRMLECARVLQLTETEWYYVEDNDEGPFSPRNEIEALNMLRVALSQLNVVHDCHNRTLSWLQEIIHGRLKMFLTTTANTSQIETAAESLLRTWAAEMGIKSILHIAVFEGTGRGGAASADVEPGDLVFEIPKEALISKDVAMESDMGPTFRKISGLSADTVALLWSMRERHDKKSVYAPYFASLPDSFHTGLSFGINGLNALQGTLVFEEIVQARQHLRKEFDELFPALSSKYPNVFPVERYTWDQFLWASQLWYSYGMRVVYPNGEVNTCLIPLASLLNHSIYPHVTRFSKMNVITNTLQLCAARPCKSGEQCFLSYGPLSNLDLLTFYGFIIEDNPYDVIPVELDLPQMCSTAQQFELIARHELGSSHMIRGHHGLPSRLIASLRVACMEEEESAVYSGNPLQLMVSLQNEKSVFEALLSIVDSLMEPLQDSNPCVSRDVDSFEWDVLLAESFKQDQRRILQSIYNVCHSRLQALQSKC